MEYPECAVGKSIALIRSKKENESYQAISYMTTSRAKSLSNLAVLFQHLDCNARHVQSKK
jgi:hypothetical protein